jgi:predicted transcriptional regulator
MRHDELKYMRLKMGLDLASMAAVLSMPYRTYQDYEYGKREIPERVALKAEQAYEKDREFMAGIAARVDARVDASGGVVPNIAEVWQ